MKRREFAGAASITASCYYGNTGRGAADVLLAGAPGEGRLGIVYNSEDRKLHVRTCQ